MRKDGQYISLMDFIGCLNQQAVVINYNDELYRFNQIVYRHERGQYQLTIYRSKMELLISSYELFYEGYFFDRKELVAYLLYQPLFFGKNLVSIEKECICL